MIKIELFDGTTLEFPEGTSQDVIDRTAKAVTQERAGQPAAPERGVMGDIGAFIKGSDREETIGGPQSVDFGSEGNRAKMTALLSTTMSPERLRNGISRIEPAAQFQKDKFGNDVALWPRKNERGEVTGYSRFYPNPAGLDQTDVVRTAGVVAAATGVGRLMQAVGLPTAGLIGGGLVGGGEAVVSEAASSMASGDPFDVTTVPYGVAGGALGDLGGRAVGSLVSLARTVGPRAVVDASGNLLPKYADMVRRAGLDPDQVAAGLAAEIATMVRQGAAPEVAAITAMSKGLPEPVPMTRGQITGSKGQQLFEDAASSGGMGSIAEALMAAQRQRQQGALTNNLDTILTRLNPSMPPIQRGAGGAAAQAELVGQRAAAKADADSLYATARAGNAVVDPTATADVATAMRSAFRQGFSPRTAPAAAGMLDDFDNVAATGDIRAMMEWRSQMTSLGKGTPTPDGAAASQVLQVFDAKIQEAVRNSLLSGDAAAATNWAKAITNYADFSNLWKSNGGVLSLLTDTTVRDGARVLKVAPERAADVIFTSTVSGLANKTGLARDLVTLQRQLPPEQWNMLRQDAFLRLMDTSKGAMRGGETQVSGVNFKKAWDGLIGRNAGVVNALFTKEERELFGQFANVAARATGGAVNSSNSANSAAAILQRLGGLMGGTGLMRFLMRVPVARSLQEAYGAARAAGATGRSLPPPTTPLTMGGAGLGSSAATSDEGREEINNRIRSFLGGPR